MNKHDNGRERKRKRKGEKGEREKDLEGGCGEMNVLSACWLVGWGFPLLCMAALTTGWLHEAV